MSELPEWMSLLAPVPPDAVPERTPVATAQQIADGTDGPIAGWENVIVNLSLVGTGLRHILITLDGTGRVIAAGDHVMVAHDETRDGIAFTISDHENIGGRFEEDGLFRGTRWKTHMEGRADADQAGETASTPSTPTDDEVAALRRIVAEIMSRAGTRRTRN